MVSAALAEVFDIESPTKTTASWHSKKVKIIANMFGYV